VTIVKYNKYNQKLLSPPLPSKNKADQDDDQSDGRFAGLKTAKKSFKKRLPV